MAVAWSWVGAVNQSTSTTTLAYPASGVVSGDAIFCHVINKASSGTGDPPSVSVVSGWTELHTAVGGVATDPSVGAVGKVRNAVWRRDADAAGTENGTTISLTNPGGSSHWHAALFGCTKAAALDIVCASGSDATAGTGFSVTPGTDPGITSGDLLVGMAGLTTATSSGSSAETITSPSATIGTVTERWDASTTSGNDTRITGWTGSCTAGTSTGAPTIGLTSASASQYGVGTIMRLRESAAGPAIFLPVAMAPRREDPYRNVDVR